jgi:precorrin-2 methylase
MVTATTVFILDNGDVSSQSIGAKSLPSIKHIINQIRRFRCVCARLRALIPNIPGVSSLSKLTANIEIAVEQSQKGTVIMRAKKLSSKLAHRVLSISMIALAVFMALLNLGPRLLSGSKVAAQVWKPGKAVFVSGNFICDCNTSSPECFCGVGS